MKAPQNSNGTYRAPTLAEWQRLLDTGSLAEPRGEIPTPLDPPREPTVFGRVAGVSEGSQWQTQITDNPNVEHLSISLNRGKAFSYALGTLHLITLSTRQIQSAPMLSPLFRYCLLCPQQLWGGIQSHFAACKTLPVNRKLLLYRSNTIEG
jgi:hypothetical protein